MAKCSFNLPTLCNLQSSYLCVYNFVHTYIIDGSHCFQYMCTYICAYIHTYVHTHACVCTSVQIPGAADNTSEWTSRIRSEINLPLEVHNVRELTSTALNCVSVYIRISMYVRMYVHAVFPSCVSLFSIMWCICVLQRAWTFYLTFLFKNL